MSELPETLAELRALHAHVVAVTAELTSRGLTVAADCVEHTAAIAALIADAEAAPPEGAAADEWVGAANGLAAQLRVEAGQIETS